MELPKLRIGDLTFNLPVVQGGMGIGVSKASLAAAVSTEGGLGVIASVGLGDHAARSRDHRNISREGLRTEIRKVKQQDLPVGVNVMSALTDCANHIRICVEEGADVIISGAGLPLRMPEYAADSPTKLVPIVSSARAADLICKTWMRKYERLPDAIVVEGPMAGGHLGFKFEDLEGHTAPTLETLVSEVLAIAEKWSKGLTDRIPVIAAGGIYTGADIARFLGIGASGVQMGTRFVATHECDAADEYKQAYLEATKEDVVLVRSPVGMPARVLRNGFIRRSLYGERERISCFYKCLLTCDARTANYCIADGLLNASRGEFLDGFAMCGQNAYRTDKIVSVHELMQELVSGVLRADAVSSDACASAMA